MAGAVGRFAPSTTGPAHPGTLLAALLCWLDTRSMKGRILLRLEDLDPERSTEQRVMAMTADLEWLGLDWDGVVKQSERRARYEDALDQLSRSGRLYPCRCTRSEIRASAPAAADSGFRYPGTCRERSLPSASAGGWRATPEPLRVRLDDELPIPVDESGFDMSAAGDSSLGDPVIRRRDGAASYHLASVVDDAASGVTRVVRGRDLAASTPLQVALQRLLGLPTPRYRHHLLLLEERGDKLAKLHGSVGAAELREHYSGPELCGLLAFWVGLRPAPGPILPTDLVADFRWGAVASEDRAVRWTGRRLELVDDAQP